MDDYTKLRRRRAIVATLGCLFGLVVGAPVTYLLYGVWFNATTFSFCCAGAATALFIGERTGRVVKAEDVEYLRFNKRLKPLGTVDTTSRERRDEMK